MNVSGKIKTIYRVTLISTSVSVFLIIALFSVLWMYIKDERLEKIDRMYDAFIRQQAEEKDVSPSRPADTQAPEVSFTGEAIGVQISELQEETKRSMSLLSNEINDSMTNIFKSLEKQLKKEKDAAANRPDSEVGRAAFEKAKTLWLKGDMATAELYFSYAISRVPDNWSYIDAYTQAILGWCRETKGDADKEIAILVLKNLEDFLRNQGHNLKLGDLSRLEKLLGRVIETRDTLEIKTEKKGTERALVKAGALLSQTLPDNIPRLEQFHSELSEVKAFLGKRDLKKSGQDASEIVSSLKKRMTAVERTQHALGLIRQAENLLELAEKVTDPASAQFSYVATAITLINQLMAYESQLAPPIAGNIRKLQLRLDRVTKTLSHKRNDAILRELLEEKKKIHAFFSIHHDKTCAEAIEKLTNIARLCEYRLAEINDQEISHQVYEILNATNRAISQWKTQQLHRYEKWVVEKIKAFYEKGMKKGGGSKGEDEIYNQFISTFGDIDTRYLSFATAKTYTEIFDLFYKDLTDKQKIRLTAEIALMDKKELKSF